MKGRHDDDWTPQCTRPASETEPWNPEWCMPDNQENDDNENKKDACDCEVDME